ncbi:MAG: hypothetical protein NT115_16215, partial [Proteobacteria bacterium]|nr:hypothetical protein [Pseudomonadota bacterium]
AARATFALNAAEWLRRGRLIFFAPWRLRRLLEQNFTYTPVRFCGATSFLAHLLFENKSESFRPCQSGSRKVSHFPVVFLTMAKPISAKASRPLQLRHPTVERRPGCRR